MCAKTSQVPTTPGGGAGTAAGTGVPSFPDFCEVSLELRDEVAGVLGGLRPEIAELTFASLFLFRKAHAYRLSRWGSLLLVTARSYGGEPYAFPPLGAGGAAEVEDASRGLCEHLRGLGGAPVLFPVPEAWVFHRYGAGWSVQADRDQADYVYSREELAQLPGKKFHKRRNRLAKLLREEASGYEYRQLGPEHVDGCLELAQGWCTIRCSTEKPSTFLETSAATDALAHRERLGLRGGVILLGGRVAAFCLGEELNPETFVVHFEKAEPSRDGLAQLINRDFCLHSLQGYRWVNREQDLGDPGLRQAKESYHPAFLAAKYRVSPQWEGHP
ncbi:MAG: DUF2156 domain-containing protein [Deferrisomatales bacterium]